MRLLIVTPTYNERDNIEHLIKRVLKVSPPIEILVVDDNSPDGTAKIVRQIVLKNPRVHLLERPEKNGIGPAYIAGFKWALARDYEAVMEMDADLSHRPRYIPKFLEGLQRYDVVAGSRWMKGGLIVNWPFSRILLSRLANIYCKWVLGVEVCDLTGGFNGYRRQVLETIDLDSIHSDGYSFQIEMKCRSLKQNFKLLEIPIVFTDRKRGDSKISRRIVWEALLIVWVLRFMKHPAPSHSGAIVARDSNVSLEGGKR